MQVAASAVEFETAPQDSQNGGLHAPDNGSNFDPSMDVDSVLAQELSENGKARPTRLPACCCLHGSVVFAV